MHSIFETELDEETTQKLDKNQFVIGVSPFSFECSEDPTCGNN
jgi:hypothetical protein